MICFILRLDRAKVFGRERLGPVEVVEPAVSRTGPMVTFTSGQISCTARAMIWARSWRISSSAGASSFSVLMAIAGVRRDRPLQIPMRAVHLRRNRRLGQRRARSTAATSAGVTPAAIVALVAIGKCQGNLGSSAVLLVGLAPTKRPVAGYVGRCFALAARPKSSRCAVRRPCGCAGLEAPSGAIMTA